MLICHLSNVQNFNNAHAVLKRWVWTVWAMIQLSKPHILCHMARDQVFQAPFPFFWWGAWVRGYRNNTKRPKIQTCFYSGHAVEIPVVSIREVPLASSNYWPVPIIEQEKTEIFTQILSSFTWMCIKWTAFNFRSMHCTVSKTVSHYLPSFFTREWHMLKGTVLIGATIQQRLSSSFGRNFGAQ